jgi:hypothetical protein
MAISELPVNQPRDQPVSHTPIVGARIRWGRRVLPTLRSLTAPAQVSMSPRTTPRRVNCHHHRTQITLREEALHRAPGAPRVRGRVRPSLRSMLASDARTRLHRRDCSWVTTAREDRVRWPRTVSCLRVNESISGVPGDNRTARMSLRPTMARRMSGLVSVVNHIGPQAKPRLLQRD